MTLVDGGIGEHALGGKKARVRAGERELAASIIRPADRAVDAALPSIRQWSPARTTHAGCWMRAAQVTVGPFEDYGNNVTAATTTDTALLLRNAQDVRHFTFTLVPRQPVPAAIPLLPLAAHRPEQTPSVQVCLAHLW